MEYTYILYSITVFLQYHHNFIVESINLHIRRRPVFNFKRWARVVQSARRVSSLPNCLIPLRIITSLSEDCTQLVLSLAIFSHISLCKIILIAFIIFTDIFQQSSAYGVSVRICRYYSIAFVMYIIYTTQMFRFSSRCKKETQMSEHTFSECLKMHIH